MIAARGVPRKGKAKICVRDDVPLRSGAIPEMHVGIVCLATQYIILVVSSACMVRSAKRLGIPVRRTLVFFLMVVSGIILDS